VNPKKNLKHFYKFPSFVLLLYIFCLTCSSLAAPLTLSRNARNSDYLRSGLVVRSLSYACFALIENTDDVSCNPTMTVFNQESHLGGEFLLGNGYANVERANRFLSSNIDESTINDLFSREKVLQSEMDISLIFRTRYFEAAFIPSRIQYLSAVRNEANPDLQLDLKKEEWFILQGGGLIFNGFYWGVRFRTGQRQFIQQEDKLFNLLVEQNRSKFKPKKQSLTLLEPGLTFQGEGVWSPSVHFVLANLGSVQGGEEEYPNKVDPQWGLGIRPPLAWGRLLFLLDYKQLGVQDQATIQKLHLGISYLLGTMTTMLGIDSRGISFGVFSALKQINTGISIATTRVSWVDSENYTQTVYLQLGMQL